MSNAREKVMNLEDTRQIIGEFLERKTCKDFKQSGNCKGMKSLFVNEDSHEVKDCRWYCLANCDPEELKYLFMPPKEVMIYTEGKEYRMPIDMYANFISFTAHYGNGANEDAHIYGVKINSQTWSYDHNDLGTQLKIGFACDDTYDITVWKSEAVIWKLSQKDILEASTILCHIIKNSRLDKGISMDVELSPGDSMVNSELLLDHRKRSLQIMRPKWIAPAANWFLSGELMSLSLDLEPPK